MTRPILIIYKNPHLVFYTFTLKVDIFKMDEYYYLRSVLAKKQKLSQNNPSFYVQSVLLNNFYKRVVNNLYKKNEN